MADRTWCLRSKVLKWVHDRYACFFSNGTEFRRTASIWGFFVANNSLVSAHPIISSCVFKAKNLKVANFWSWINVLNTRATSKPHETNLKKEIHLGWLMIRFLRRKILCFGIKKSFQDDIVTERLDWFMRYRTAVRGVTILHILLLEFYNGARAFTGSISCW